MWKKVAIVVGISTALIAVSSVQLLKSHHRKQEEIAYYEYLATLPEKEQLRIITHKIETRETTKKNHLIKVVIVIGLLSPILTASLSFGGSNYLLNDVLRRLQREDIRDGN